MERGTMDKIFKYYFTTPQYRDEVLRAMREFFDRPDLGSDSAPLELEEEDDARFNEWFAFDFRLANGRTVLEDFCQRNPQNLSSRELQVYEDMKENFYGAYEVRRVSRGKGLTLQNLQTGKMYEVQEFLGTFDIKRGQILIGRVGKVGDHHELIGGNGIRIPATLSASARKFYRDMKGSLNPKIARELFFGKKRDERAKPHLSPEQAERELSHTLQKYELDTYVNTAVIREWIYDVLDKKDETNGLNMLCSLLPHQDKARFQKILDEVIGSYMNFYNTCPQKILSGKSPMEKSEEPRSSDEPSYKVSNPTLLPWDWEDDYSATIGYMKKGKFDKALAKYKKTFLQLLKYKMTFPDIFRPYANKALCHFALGEEALGKEMLNIALYLNPHYGFAKAMLRKYKKGEFKDVIARPHLEELAKLFKETQHLVNRKSSKREKRSKAPLYADRLLGDEGDVSKDIGYVYFQFLKKYKINFDMLERTPPQVTVIGSGRSLGRNDPRWCNSGKKFKRCHLASSS